MTSGQRRLKRLFGRFQAQSTRDFSHPKVSVKAFWANFRQRYMKKLLLLSIIIGFAFAGEKQCYEHEFKKKITRTLKNEVNISRPTTRGDQCDRFLERFEHDKNYGKINNEWELKRKLPERVQNAAKRLRERFFWLNDKTSNLNELVKAQPNWLTTSERDDIKKYDEIGKKKKLFCRLCQENESENKNMCNKCDELNTDHRLYFGKLVKIENSVAPLRHMLVSCFSPCEKKGAYYVPKAPNICAISIKASYQPGTILSNQSNITLDGVQYESSNSQNVFIFADQFQSQTQSECEAQVVNMMATKGNEGHIKVNSNCMYALETPKKLLDKGVVSNHYQYVSDIHPDDMTDNFIDKLNNQSNMKRLSHEFPSIYDKKVPCKKEVRSPSLNDDEHELYTPEGSDQDRNQGSSGAQRQ